MTERAADEILDRLIERGLVVPLTGPGRGQLFTHNLYQPAEMERLKSDAAMTTASGPPSRRPSGVSPDHKEELDTLRQEMAELRLLVEALSDRVHRLET